MSPITEKDAIIEAQALTNPLQQKTEKKRKAFLENAATYISLMAIMLSIVLYAYNRGYLAAYNLPQDCMNLDLKNYIPLCIQALGVAMLGCAYIASIKSDITLEKKQFNLLRVLNAIYIIDCIIRYNHIQNALGTIKALCISPIIAVTVELLFYFRKRPNINKSISDAQYRASVEEYVQNIIFNTYYLKYGLCILVIATTIAPLLGDFSAHTRLEYQIVEDGKTKNAVIVDYENKVLVQKVIEVDGILVIDNSNYQYLPKEGLILSYRQYDKTIFKGEK